MSTTTAERVDVNAAFAAERATQQAQVTAFNREAEAWNARPLAERQAEALAAEQARFAERVAKGELVDLGGGRFQSTEGWDRGEVWTLRQSATGDRQLLVMPEHGLDLDEVTGKAKLYSAVPAWHGLGQVIPGGITDVADVIKLAGLDVPVFHRPVPSYVFKGQRHQVPGKFIVGNGLTGEFWGIVGKVHKNIPVETSFGFMQNLVDDHSVVWESAGLMGGGRLVFISCKVPDGIVIDAEGVNDYSDLFLVVQDARDGSGAYLGMATPWRPICQNTNRFGLRDAVSSVRLRHTVGLPGRIEQARKALGMTVKYAETFGAEETELARVKVNMAEAEQLMAEFFTESDKGAAVFGGRDKAQESNRTRLANDRREDDLTGRLGTEFGRVGRTLYAVEQAATGYLDWGKVRKGTDAAAKWQARIEASLAGQDDDKKSAIHDKLMLRVRG